ncbi:MAG: NDP-sugar synthase [Thermoprotei archaeon]
MKALILAGGFGKRLRPLTEDTPKPLLRVSGKPIMAWQFEWLKAHGINEIVVCAGYLKEKIVSEVGSGTKYQVKVGYVIEEEPLGKGGAIKNAEQFLRNESKFLVLNGDVLTNIDPEPLLKALKGNTVGCMAVVPLPSPYGIVKYDKNTLNAKEFLEKPKLTDYWINAGVYAFTPEIFSWLPEKGEIEEYTFPRLAERKMLAVREYADAFWTSVDSHKDLEEASKILDGEKDSVLESA